MITIRLRNTSTTLSKIASSTKIRKIFTNSRCASQMTTMVAVGLRSTSFAASLWWLHLPTVSSRLLVFGPLMLVVSEAAAALCSAYSPQVPSSRLLCSDLTLVESSPPSVFSPPTTQVRNGHWTILQTTFSLRLTITSLSTTRELIAKMVRWSCGRLSGWSSSAAPAAAH